MSQGREGSNKGLPLSVSVSDSGSQWRTYASEFSHWRDEGARIVTNQLLSVEGSTG